MVEAYVLYKKKSAFRIKPSARKTTKTSKETGEIYEIINPMFFMEFATAVNPNRTGQPQLGEITYDWENKVVMSFSTGEAMALSRDLYLAINPGFDPDFGNNKGTVLNEWYHDPKKGGYEGSAKVLKLSYAAGGKIFLSITVDKNTIHIMLSDHEAYHLAALIPHTVATMMNWTNLNELIYQPKEEGEESAPPKGAAPPTTEPDDFKIDEEFTPPGGGEWSDDDVPF